MSAINTIGSLRVWINFRDLNTLTPKDEYHMFVADILVDSAFGNEILSLVDRYLGYNKIFIEKKSSLKKKMYLKLHLDALDSL